MVNAPSEIPNTSSDRQIVNSLPGLVWVSNGTTPTRTIANHAGRDFIGQTSADVVDWFTHIHPADVSAYRQLWDTMTGTRQPFSAEYRLRHCDGSYRWLLEKATPLRTDGGITSGYIGTCQDITVQKQVEAEREEIISRLQRAFEMGQVGVWEVDLLTGRVTTSTNCDHLFGVESGTEKTVELYLSRIHPDDRDQVGAAIEQTVGYGQEHYVEYRVIRPDGSVRWIGARGCAVYEGADNPRRMAGVLQDITERKQAEEALRESEERFRIAFETANDAMVLSDASGIVLAANEAYCQLYGYSPQEVIGQRFEIIFPEHLRQQAREQYRQVFERQIQQPAYETSVRRKDGTERTVEARIGFVTWQGKPKAMLSVIRDVTERKQAEAALRRSEQLARDRLAEIEAIYDTAPVGLCVLDTDLRYTRINRRLAEMNGLPVEAHLGHNVDKMVPYLAPTVIPMFRRVLETGEAILNFELHGETNAQPGVRRTWIVSWVPFRNHDGQMVGINIVADEVTEQRRLEQALEDSRRLSDAMISTIPDLFYVYDLVADENIYVNPQVGRLLGYTSDEITEQGTALLGRLIHPDDIPVVVAARDRLKTASDDAITELEYRMQRKDGEWRWFYSRDMVFERLPDGAVAKTIGIAQDITERKRVEAEREHLLKQLRDERARLETILKQIPVGVIVAEAPSGRLILGNDAVERIWRHRFLPADQTEQYRQYVGFHKDGRPYRPEEWPLARTIATGVTVQDEEIDFLRGDGTMGTMLASSAPILDDTGAVAAGVVAFLDITERQLLITAERDQRLLTQAMLDVTMAINNTLELEDVLERTLSSVGLIVPHDASLILLVEQDVARVAWFKGIDDVGEDIRESLRRLEMKVSDTTALREMAGTRRSLIVPNIYEYPGWVYGAKEPEQPILFSFLGVPLFLHGELIGFLDLYSRTPGFFTPSHAGRLAMFAEIVTTVIHNAHLYRQAQTAAVLEERQRIARDLHDAISQTLFSARMIAESLPRLLEVSPKRLPTLLEQLAALNRSAQSEMRVLLIELRPEQLLRTELRDQYTQLVDVLRGRGNVQVELTLNDGQPVPPPVQAALYRITQEAFNNIIKHAKASRVWLEVLSLPDAVKLHIRDNGRGFDPIRTTSGLGLTSMRERAAQIGAEFHFASVPGQGTEVTVTWQRD